ncbi:MAG: M48 family metalloprotease [Terriglobales bacterium]
MTLPHPLRRWPTLLLGLTLPALALAQALPMPPPPPAAAPLTAAQVLARMSAHERQLWDQMREMKPRVETYLQNMRVDPVLGNVPVADRYYLGILDFSHGRFSTVSFLPRPRQTWRRWIGPLDDLGTAPARHMLDLDLFGRTFAGMLFPGGPHFDQKHYRFVFRRREFLGEVRCYVFDVVPLDPHAKGSFWGRIWVEDHDDVLVRFNGSFWENRYGHPDLHFDSWRVNVRPRVWLPAYIYCEESDLGYGLFRHARFQAQTRLWGYDLKSAGHQQELTTLSVEGADMAAQAPPPQPMSPVIEEREWQQQAAQNVLDRLEKAGLLAPAGPADEVLDTVVQNLELPNKVGSTPPVTCRILLTTPLESLIIGHTIVLSRGLIDSLPNESSLAAMLAHELAHIVLGQQIDTRYAFTDRMLFPDQDSLRLINLKRTPGEEQQANQLAVKLLEHSPYKDTMGEAGLFLRQVAERRKLAPHLFDPNLGNGWFSRDYLNRLHALEVTAPALHQAAVAQMAALPLGGRLMMNPWDDSVRLVTPAPVSLLSAHEKMPLQVTPFFPVLRRYSAPDSKAAATAKVGSDPGGGQ